MACGSWTTCVPCCGGQLQQRNPRRGIEEFVPVDVSIRILLREAVNVPSADYYDASDTYVLVTLVSDDEVIRCSAHPNCTRTIDNSSMPIWNEEVELGIDVNDTHALLATRVRFTLMDQDSLTEDDYIGEAEISLKELIRRPLVSLLITNRDGDAVFGSSTPRKLCELKIENIVAEDHNPELPIPEPRSYSRDQYPKHIFMMSRGTRGDVQPFVALARGFAEEFGWMVTICTELKWKSFVKDKTKDLEQGVVRFLPSGGDTAKRISRWEAKKAMESKSEMMQTMMLGFAEAEFFSSAPVFIEYFERLRTSTPVDLIMPSFTLMGLGMLLSERYQTPMMGFILQPTCIPSADEDWHCVGSIKSHGNLGFLDDFEDAFFTSQKSLAWVKRIAENSIFSSFSLDKLRQEYGLSKAETWPTLLNCNTPMLIPMLDGTFKRPSDWPSRITFTDFIFLRSKNVSGGGLSPELQSFIQGAVENGRKLAVMTFSSMPVARKKMLTCAMKMLKDAKHNFSLIYVGSQQTDEIPDTLKETVELMSSNKKFIELQRADFGELFKSMDCFIVHGGLGTTVEALRMHKPVAVTGLLLMDQRFWGGVVESKGIGPAPVHIDDFHESCVAFIDGALKPDSEWLKNAEAASWGAENDDGVKENIDAVMRLLGENLKPVNSFVQNEGGVETTEREIYQLKKENYELKKAAVAEERARVEAVRAAVAEERARVEAERAILKEKALADA